MEECSITFETEREKVILTPTPKPTSISGVRVFAICVTTDNVPIVAQRRTSFVFQHIVSTSSKKNTTKVSKHLLQYMYENEVRELACRSSVRKIEWDNNFCELIMIGGKANKSESVNSCLRREIREESDSTVSVKSISDKFFHVSIYDKLIQKCFECYCTLCYINQSLEDITSTRIFNIEVRSLCPLYSYKNNDKFEYLNFIYKSLS
ncbi:mRNA decapping enzyme [Pteropox virus]|uniref:mRNA decapping enzyme n=1 Tax=Pteropox virus TaxID=1873698 RepID=A0A1B1MRJ4_9POXV|nr:mRNA decapping enzyme [Pteropox virus]ANS71173.1 mRNA decapping enzyme [Pteropox virus]